ncbi:hypothetical protein D3C81_516110 [compost metagenome]|jgi:hypothetical protein
MNRKIALITSASRGLLCNIQLKGPFFLTQRLLPLIADLNGQRLEVSGGMFL